MADLTLEQSALLQSQQGIVKTTVISVNLAATTLSAVIAAAAGGNIHTIVGITCTGLSAAAWVKFDSNGTVIWEGNFSAGLPFTVGDFVRSPIASTTISQALGLTIEAPYVAGGAVTTVGKLIVHHVTTRGT